METGEEKATRFQYSRDQFLELVKDALEHVYDLTHLENHPFAPWVNRKDDIVEDTRGQLLQKDLSRAIDMLDSGQARSSGSSPLRRHNIMRLRYLERLTIPNISYELGISERQIHRDLRQGEEDLATILWSWYMGEAAVLNGGDSKQDESVTLEIEQLQTNFQRIDIGRLVSAAISSIEQLSSKRNVEIVVNVPLEPVMISTDPVVAKHVLINLFSSAVQKSDGAQVDMLLRSNDERTNLTLCFASARESNESLINDITAQLLHRLRWEINQNISQGTRRIIELTFGKNVPTVLVIDDYEGLSRLLKRYLAGYPCRILAATDGASGLSLARDIQPDAVILDVMMPNMDGWEVLQRLRNHPDTQHIAVVICSVFDDPELAYALGASSFLSKPVKREDIIKALRMENIL
jgi:CheY-like chemotaxis protein